MTYEVWQGFAQNDAGDVLDTATVTVTLAGTTTKPALFSDEDGTGSKTNPFTTDASGFVQFYTAPAIVDIVATKGAFSVTFSNVRIGLPDALQTVATLAELVASSPAAGSLTGTKGYWYAGDGGDWEYLVKTSAQAAIDGDVIDEYINHTLTNGNVAVGQYDGGSFNALRAGAKPGDNSVDSAVRIQSALDLFDDVFVPKTDRGSYYLDELNPTIYGYQDRCYFVIAGTHTLGGFREGVKFWSNGAVFEKLTTPAAGLESGFIHLDVVKNFEVFGFSLTGSNTGTSPTAVNTGIILSSCYKGKVHDIEMLGDFSGTNSTFAGNYVIDVEIENIKGDDIGLGFDFAAIQDVSVDGAKYTGSDGAGGKGDRGFSGIWDGVVQGTPGADNFTGITFDNLETIDGTPGFQNSSRIRVGKNCSFRNFNSGIAVATGRDWDIEEGIDLQENTNGVWVVAWNNTGSPQFSSYKVPPKNVYIGGGGSITNNDYGVLVETGSAGNHGIIDGLNITGRINANTAFDIAALNETVGGVPYITNVVIGPGYMDSISNSFDSAMIRAAYTYGPPLIRVNNVTPWMDKKDPNELFKGLPAGTGSGNLTINDHPFVVFVTIYDSTVAYSPVKRTWNNDTSSALEVSYGTKPANSGPLTIMMKPGEEIYFNTNVPSTGWTWEAW